MGKDKLKRFAEVETFDNVFQPSFDDINKDFRLKYKWNKEFNNNNPIVLELGCGKGEYTVGLAKQFPNKNFIGIDIKGSRIWRGAKTCVEENIDNVRFIRTKIDFIEKFFANNEINEIWLTFSDPQPKRPRKRLTSPLFINRYKNILNKKGVINIKTDSSLLYNYTLDEIKNNNYTILENSSDIYNELINRANNELISKINIKTFYEQKWLEEEKKIKFISFMINN
jgi:tRNA (guanine-N7-)-methyltransferase